MGIYLKKYSWVVFLFFIFIGTYFLAKIVSTFLATQIRIEKKFQPVQMATAGPETTAPASFEDYRVIMERNIFDSREIAPQPETQPEVGQVDLTAPAVKTTLGIKLISTFSVGDGTDRRSSATISSGTGQPDTFSIGDEKQFSPGVELKKILPDRIEFVNNRRLEYAEIEGFGGGVTTNTPVSSLDKAAPGGAAPVGGGEGVATVGTGKFVVARGEVDQALGNLDKLFTEIRAVPQFEGGKTTGLKLLSIREGSLFSKLGLQRNDVLQRVNGQPFDMQKGMEIFGQLKDADRVSIDLIRNGTKTTLEYQIQ
jgi:general secretion pathway protein C